MQAALDNPGCELCLAGPVLDPVDGDEVRDVDAAQRGGEGELVACIYRFAATLPAIDPAGPVEWVEIAGRAGYYDQAHFTHDFRRFTGLTPTRYLEAGGDSSATIPATC